MLGKARSIGGGVAALALAAGFVALAAGPAGAVSVSTEAQLRAAFLDVAETEVVLTADIDLTDCGAAHVLRPGRCRAPRRVGCVHHPPDVSRPPGDRLGRRHRCPHHPGRHHHGRAADGRPLGHGRRDLLAGRRRPRRRHDHRQHGHGADQRAGRWGVRLRRARGARLRRVRQRGALERRLRRSGRRDDGRLRPHRHGLPRHRQPGRRRRRLRRHRRCRVRQRQRHDHPVDLQRQRRRGGRRRQRRQRRRHRHQRRPRRHQQHDRRQLGAKARTGTTAGSPPAAT